MKLIELWILYEADKRILGFSPHTLKAYQLKVLIREIGNREIEEVTLNLLKEYLAKQSERLKPSSLGHRIRFVRSLFRFAFEEGRIGRNPALKLREPKMDKRIPKFLIKEDIIHHIDMRPFFRYLLGIRIKSEIFSIIRTERCQIIGDSL